jgi:hypothetical protein
MTVTVSYESLDDLSLIVSMLKASCTDGSKEFSIFGGAPRDLLRGVPPRDIDVYIRDHANVVNFVKFLVDANRLRKQVKHEGHYASISLEIDTNDSDMCLVDVTTNSERFYHLCDFTCNNLIMGPQGSISTRVPPPSSTGMTRFEWTGRCVQDAIHGRLSCMIRENSSMSPAAYMNLYEHLQKRIAKFVEKGYSISNADHLTEIGLRKIKAYTSDESCSICQEEYTDAAGGILLKCTHHFHFKCINEWIDAGTDNNAKCPVCRAVIQCTTES